MTGQRTLQVLIMLSGLLAWAVQFTVIYGVTSTLCARGWADVTVLGMGVVQLTIMVTTAAALVFTAVVLIWSLREYRRLEEPSAPAATSFMIQTSILINGLSVVVILWHGVPAFILPTCA